MRALKEWSSVVRALESGAQTVLLRKGGILDTASGFRFEDGPFALFPTHEHQDESSIKPEHRHYLEEAGGHGESHNTVGSYAETVAEADVSSPAPLRALSGMHIWSDSYIRARTAWKPERPLRAALLRVYVSTPARVPVGPEHSGCKSWVGIDYNPGEGRPVMDGARAEEARRAFEEAVSA